MYRPCMHCEGKKYDPDYCPDICDYGCERQQSQKYEKFLVMEFERRYSDTVKEECVALFRSDQVSEEDVERYIRDEAGELRDKIVIMSKTQYYTIFEKEV